MLFLNLFLWHKSNIDTLSFAGIESKVKRIANKALSGRIYSIDEMAGFDGKNAVNFLVDVKKMIENPSSTLHDGNDEGKKLLGL